MTHTFTPSFTTDPPSTRRLLQHTPTMPSVSKTLARPMWAATRRLLANLQDGHLRVTLPNGSVHRFGPPTAERKASVNIRDMAVFSRLATRPRLALGEGYTAGEWSTDDLPLVLELLHGLVEQTKHEPPWNRLLDLQERGPHVRAPRVRDFRKARDDVSYHYDLGNDFYELFLDETMTYSAAYFTSADQTLADAQMTKYERMCQRARICADDHVLEIGCGWGGFAVHAATTTGCRVTAVTLSSEQAAYARERVRAAGVADRVDVIERDYRLVAGTYSKIVSIEMIEAVGHDLATFFATCDRLLATDGLMAIQAIVKPDQRGRRTRKLDDGWIERYIFPGSLIPSVSLLTTEAADRSSLVLQDAEEFGPSYARTLAEWRRSFLANAAEVEALGYDPTFTRTWEFYLATAEAGFRYRYLRDFHLTFTRIGNQALPVFPSTGPRF